MDPQYRAYIEASRPRLYRMAKENYGLELNVGQIGTTSRSALIGGKFAEAHGVGDAYHDRVFRAFWQEAKDIGDAEILADIAQDLGLDREEFLSALNDPLYVQRVVDDVQTAHAYGLSAVPAIVFENKYLVSGAQPYETLVEVAEKALAEAGNA